jgi:RND family efflux transporter MFP subunit
MRSTALPVAVFFAWCAVSCGTSPKPQQNAPDPLPVTVGFPTRVQQPKSVTVSGTVVSPDNPVNVAFTVGGRVARVGPRIGDAVRRGEVLAVLETTQYTLALDAAVAQVAAARVTVSRAEDELRRAQQLLDTRSLPPNDFEKIRAAAAASRESLAQALASEGLARKRLDDTTLHSPLDGYVAARTIEPGNVAGPGIPAFQIIRLDPVEVSVGVPESDVHLVGVGSSAEVTVPALPGESFAGAVRLVNVAADPATRTYMTRIQVRNPRRLLRIGMVASATIRGKGMDDVLTIPAEALVRDPQGATSVFVYFPEQNRVHTRLVEVGPPRGTQVEVVNGLTASDRIVIAGQERLRDGMVVTATTSSPDPPEAQQ